jgi:hypothetical protein
MPATARSLFVLAGVDFSQVDLSSLYIRIGLALAALHLVALAAVPTRLLPQRWGRAWRRGLLALLALGWIDVLIGFEWPEVIRGHDFFNIFSVIGGLVVAPIATLITALMLHLLQRRRERSTT